MRLLPSFSILLLAAAASSANAAVISIAASGSYTQDFDTLATTGSANVWVNDSTIPGWYAERETGGMPTAYLASAGGSSTGGFYSFGTGTATERAFGSISSGTPNDLAYGVVLKNDAATTVTIDLISYTGEQWRNGNNVNAHLLEFSYSIGVAVPTLEPGVITGGAANWIAVSALNFTSPVTGATTIALDGNATGNFTNLTDSSVITLQPNDFITLRWRDNNDAGNDHGLALDNLKVNYTVVPEPGLSLLALGSLGLLLRRRR